MANHQIETENKAMKDILIAMQNLGGPVTRKDILQELRENSNYFSQEQIDKEKTSKKTGTVYHPFRYTLNFAVKYLILAGFITDLGHYQLELSKKGRNVDLNTFDAQKDVRLILKQNSKESALEDETAEAGDVSDEAPWCTQLLDALMKMNPKKFELFCRGLLVRMGVDVDDKIGVQYVADGGLDGFGYVQSDDYRTTRVALQAKRWHGKVSSPEIDKFRGAMDKYNAEFGIFITNSDFTRDARKTARQGTRIITLINGEKICDLVAKYNYYVEPVTTYRLKDFYLDED